MVERETVLKQGDLMQRATSLLISLDFKSTADHLDRINFNEFALCAITLVFNWLFRVVSYTKNECRKLCRLHAQQCENYHGFNLLCKRCCIQASLTCGLTFSELHTNVYVRREHNRKYTEKQYYKYCVYFANSSASFY